jgi:glycosyltransferase involved in cell wall biosynthesis
MPRVLRIINRFNLGGITYNVSYLSKYLPASYETLLIGGPEEEGEESSLFIPESLGIKPVLIKEMRRSLNPLSDFFAYRRILALMRSYKPDIVHTHASKAGAIGRLAARRAGVPIIVHTFHGHVFKGYFGSVKTGLFKWIERYLAARSTAIVAISALQKIELTQSYSICAAEKTHVIPLGFDLQRFTEQQEEKRKNFRQRYSIPDSTLAIGIIGRLAPIKNHYLFLDAVDAVLKKTDRALCALIIGDGETRQALETYLKTKEVRTREAVVFAGWIKEVDVALAGLDLVALSSTNEGTPVSLIEAQAAGKFIVSTNVGGISDILHKGSGLLSEPGDDQAFINNLLIAVHDYETCTESASKARESVLQNFSYERLCRDMDALYNDLAG